MSEDIAKALQTAIARIAQLEERITNAKKADPAALTAHGLTHDPVGTMLAAGIPVDQVTKILVRHTLGDSAPESLKEFSAGQQQLGTISASLDAKLADLSRRLEEATSGSRVERFKATAADKTKYPHLAAALAKDPSLFDEDVGSGDAVETAAKLEARLAKLAPALAPQSTSGESVENKVAEGSQAKPALGALHGDPPPIQQPKPGAMTDDIYAQLKDEVVRQHEQK